MLGKCLAYISFPELGFLCRSLGFPAGAKPPCTSQNQSSRDRSVEEGTIHGRGTTVRRKEDRMGNRDSP